MTARGGTATRTTVALLAVACLALGFLGGWASNRPSPPAPTILAQLTRDLDLRPEQVRAIAALLTDEDEDVAGIVADHAQRLRAPIAERRERTQQDLLALLDAEQRARFDELSAEEQR